MTRLLLRMNPVVITPGISFASMDDATSDYLGDCLNELYEGSDGLIDDEEHEANEADLARGCGKVVAKYPAHGHLLENFYIVAYFDEAAIRDENHNYTLIMYVSEYDNELIHVDR